MRTGTASPPAGVCIWSQVKSSSFRRNVWAPHIIACRLKPELLKSSQTHSCLQRSQQGGSNTSDAAALPEDRVCCVYLFLQSRSVSYWGFFFWRAGEGWQAQIVNNVQILNTVSEKGAANCPELHLHQMSEPTKFFQSKSHIQLIYDQFWDFYIYPSVH